MAFGHHNKETDPEHGNANAELGRHSSESNSLDGLDEYTALQKWISTYRDPKQQDVDPEFNNDSVADNQPSKSWWQFWRSSGAGRGPVADPSFVPNEYLETDIRSGLSGEEVERRRKRYGFNELESKKTNPFLKFLSYFQGPILYGKPSLQL